MEKTVRCKDCGDNVVPEFGLCPVCGYKFERIDYMQSGVEEEDFIPVDEITVSKSSVSTFIKVAAFVVILGFVLFTIFLK
jgi:uncharacterized OB-fold protein